MHNKVRAETNNTRKLRVKIKDMMVITTINRDMEFNLRS